MEDVSLRFVAQRCAALPLLTPLSLCRESRPIDETADKLDGMMDIVFAHLGRYVYVACAGDDSADQRSIRRRISGGDFDGTVQTLLRAFQLSLLQTYKSKFTQASLPAAHYVHTLTLARAVPRVLRMHSGREHARCLRLLRFAGASARVGLGVLTHRTERFAQFSKVADASQPPILRVAAASYVASFLVRAWLPAFASQHELSVAVACRPARRSSPRSSSCSG